MFLLGFVGLLLRVGCNLTLEVFCASWILLRFVLVGCRLTGHLGCEFLILVLGCLFDIDFNDF